MCDSIQDGGRRCIPPMKRKAARITASIERLEEDGHDAQNERRALALLHQDIAEHEAAQGAVREQQAKRRLERAEDPTPASVRFTISQSLNTKLEAEAREAGVSVSALVRTKLSQPMAFQDKPVEDVDPLDGKTERGRGRTEAGHLRDKRKTVRISKTVRKQLDALAAELHLTRSDLVLTLLEGRDPRQNGGHMAKPSDGDDRATAARRTKQFRRLEQAHGGDKAAIKRFYQDTYRNHLPSVITPS